MSQSLGKTQCGHGCTDTTSRRTILRSAVALGVAAGTPRLRSTQAQTAPASAVPPYIPQPETEILTPIAGPLTPETQTFRVLTARNDEVIDLDDNRFTQWMQEQTNVQVAWDAIPEDDMQSKLNVMLSSGDIPDIVFGFVNPSQLLLYGSQGIFLRLNELIEEHAPRAQRIFEMYPAARAACSAPDGSIYSMPGWGECFHCTFNQKLWIYQPWLDQLGLSVPTTTDELEQVLTAFKDNDPNGNGRADEVPLSGSLSESHSQLPSYFMNAFVFNPGEPFLIVEDGVVTPIHVTDGWKEGLKYLHRLYAQGLIDPQILTQDEDQLQRLGNNPDDVLLGAVLGNSAGVAVSISNEADARWAEYVPVPPLTGPAGVRFAGWLPYLPAYAAAPITQACPDPALAVRWIDSFYWQEATLRLERGVLDQEWRWALEGEIDVKGDQAIWKLLIVHTEPSNVSWAGTGPMYMSQNLFNGIAIDETARDLNVESILYNATKDFYEPYKPPLEMVLPPLALTTDQAIAIADPEATIVQFVKQMLAQFVRGDTEIDAGWDDYVATIEQMGLTAYIQAYQDAFDARAAT
ncbi:MAG: extracellular solute-binding protein [Thermomicrobiales bacterium]